MQSMEMEMRPPYITWHRVESEDRAATAEKGHYVPKFVDYAHVTRPGQKDTLVKDANDFIRDSFVQVKQQRLPAAWAELYKQSYERWKSGEEGQVDGTPIKGWSAIGAGAQEAIIRAGVLSIEDLAQMPDSQLQQIGMGAMGYKQKAIAWLAAGKDIGKVAEQIIAQEVKMKAMQETIDTLLAERNQAKTETKAKVTA